MVATSYPQPPRRANTPPTVPTPDPRRGPSPLLRHRADLLYRIAWDGGGKLRLTDQTYADLAGEGLPRHAVDYAVEVLWREGAVDVRLAGDTAVIAVVDYPPPTFGNWRCR